VKKTEKKELLWNIADRSHYEQYIREAQYVYRIYECDYQSEEMDNPKNIIFVDNKIPQYDSSGYKEYDEEFFEILVLQREAEFEDYRVIFILSRKHVTHEALKDLSELLEAKNVDADEFFSQF